MTEYRRPSPITNLTQLRMEKESQKPSQIPLKLEDYLAALKIDLTRFDVLEACFQFAPLWDAPFIKDKPRFLYALSGVESNYGRNNKPRFEAAYAPGGRYFTNELLQRKHIEYSNDASCSWGPWQIMYIVAAEYGYESEPLHLHLAETSCYYVIEHLNKFVRRGAQSIEDLLDSYNTGNFRDSNKPVGYISKFFVCYEECEKLITEYRGLKCPNQ